MKRQKKEDKFFPRKLMKKERSRSSSIKKSTKVSNIDNEGSDSELDSTDSLFPRKLTIVRFILY